MTGQDVATIQGEVIQPAHISEPHSFPAHGFLNVVRDLVHQGNAYRTQDAQHAALDAIDAYEKHVVAKGDQQHVISESDNAGREDVTQRVPASGPVLPQVSPQQPIDYDKLAAAIVAAQQKSVTEDSE